MDAKGLLEEPMASERNHHTRKESRQVAERRQEIMKRGSIPEFVPIKDSYELYQIYTEANLKNKLLVQN